MSDDNREAQNATLQWFEIEIPIRGRSLDLDKIRQAYRELAELNKREATRVIGALIKPDIESEEDFIARKERATLLAFKVTVSIIGGDDNVTKYGEDVSVFDKEALPYPIKTIFFTNENAYKNQASGQSPDNAFSIWIHFDKPPLFDTNPLLSEPTPNGSIGKIKASDVTFFRATQSIINKTLNHNRIWYWPIHEKFAYDAGFWFLWAPYMLFSITYYMDKFIKPDGPHASYRVPLYIYSIGILLLIYKFSYGYLKWAFPLNVLKENKDASSGHRYIFGAVILGVLGNAASHFFGL